METEGFEAGLCIDCAKERNNKGKRCVPARPKTVKLPTLITANVANYQSYSPTEQFVKLLQRVSNPTRALIS